MNYLQLNYSLEHKAIEIFLSGCSGQPKCEGCHNQLSWNFDQGENINNIYTKIDNMLMIDKFNIIKNIMIFGGEPLDQDLKELSTFLSNLKKYNKLIWLFTRFNIDEINANIKTKCDYIKTGRYIHNLKTNNNVQFGIKLSTSNQQIHKITN